MLTSVTRSRISFAVSTSSPEWDAVIHTFRYIACTLNDFGLLYTRGTSFRLGLRLGFSAYSDRKSVV